MNEVLSAQQNASHLQSPLAVVEVARRTLTLTRFAIAVLFLFAVISGCATSQHAVSVTPRDLADLHEWQASGRIAVSGANAGGSGSFTWVQHGADADVRLRGPVGIGSLRLTLSDQSLRVDTGDGQHYVAADAEMELAERLGAAVPTQDLRYWLIAMAAPGEHRWSTVADTTTLFQHGWRIDYQQFGETGGAHLPLKLVAASGFAKVRIVIDRWKVK